MTRAEGWTAVPTWLIRESDLTPNELLVLLVLLSRVNASGVCWPSLDTIATEARCGRSTVKRSLKTLAAKGLVSWTTRRSESGDLTSSVYRTHVENPVARWVHSEPTSVQSDPTVGPEGPEGGSTVDQELDPENYTHPKRAAAQHIHEPNARRALAAIADERRLPIPVDELLAMAYQAGGGDPWAGYLAIKDASGSGMTGVRDVAAVLRSRLGLARQVAR